MRNKLDPHSTAVHGRITGLPSSCQSQIGRPPVSIAAEITDGPLWKVHRSHCVSQRRRGDGPGSLRGSLGSNPPKWRFCSTARHPSDLFLRTQTLSQKTRWRIPGIPESTNPGTYMPFHFPKISPNRRSCVPHLSGAQSLPRGASVLLRHPATGGEDELKERALVGEVSLPGMSWRKRACRVLHRGSLSSSGSQ
jgi:hypothetical protein